MANEISIKIARAEYAVVATVKGLTYRDALGAAYRLAAHVVEDRRGGNWATSVESLSGAQASVRIELVDITEAEFQRAERVLNIAWRESRR